MARPKHTIIERLRSKLWYLNVKYRTGWSDYRLDMEFGQSEEAGQTSGAVRTRVFDVIRKKETLPSRGDHHRRPFDIVARVENHPLLKGTHGIVDSLFWELLSLSPRDIDETSWFVRKCLDRFGLTRISGEDSLDWALLVEPDPGEGSLKSTGSNSYERALRRATKGIPLDLDLVALFGALYREACLDFCLDNAEIAGIMFKLALTDYLGAPWVGSAGNLLSDIAINRVLHGRTNYLPCDGISSIQNTFGTVSQRLIASKNDPELINFYVNRDAVARVP